MRKPFLSLAAVVFVATACGSSASSGGYAQGPDLQHHQPTYPPPAPAASAYDGNTFKDPGRNPVTDTDEDHVSTFAMDVDTASYAIAQRYVADGNVPDPASVRVEEWVNAFDQGYEPPRQATFAIAVDGAPTPFSRQDDVLLRVGIQARQSSERARPDAALTFVIDTSGSMERDGRLELVKDSLRKLVRSLGSRDSIAVVAFGDTARVVLTPTRATDEATILRAIDELKPGGSTNLEAGLTLGYSLARETLLGDGGIDRIILASDGVANVGLTDANAILGQIRDDAAAGIELVSVGVGMGNYNDVLLEQLADQGDGFYAYINDLAEARRLFTEDLVGTLQTRRPRRQGPGRVRPGGRRDLPAHRLREPGGRGQPVPRSGGRRRSDRGRPCGDRPVRAHPALRCRPRRDARDRQAALDRAGCQARVEAGPSHPGERPRRAVRGDRADLQARRDRRGQRGGDPRRPDGAHRAWAGSSTRRAACRATCRRPTRSTTSWTSSIEP